MNAQALEAYFLSCHVAWSRWTWRAVWGIPRALRRRARVRVTPSGLPDGDQSTMRAAVVRRGDGATPTSALRSLCQCATVRLAVESPHQMGRQPEASRAHQRGNRRYSGSDTARGPLHEGRVGMSAQIPLRSPGAPRQHASPARDADAACPSSSVHTPMRAPSRLAAQSKQP